MTPIQFVVGVPTLALFRQGGSGSPLLINLSTSQAYYAHPLTGAVTALAGGGGGSGTVTNTGALVVDQLVVGNAGTDVKSLAAGANGLVLTMVAGVPAWAAGASAEPANHSLLGGL